MVANSVKLLEMTGPVMNRMGPIMENLGKVLSSGDNSDEREDENAGS